MFNKDSALVKIWVSLILSGVYTYEQCPNMSNLRVVVGEVLAEAGYIV
jgi:frataxin-like iron-binding protein CyaY